MSKANEAMILYNQIRAKGSHNSYQRTEGLDDLMLYWRLRGIEAGKTRENLGLHLPS